ncbi:MAG: nuclear transport factor 2 family protein [Deltaproteobacteria bacterium]|nr:nuclear transport factor 2 family protein [Deltaproteobacteria bacterium]
MNAVLQTWIEKVNAGDLEGVLEMYDDSATLLPTFSPQQATTKAAIRSYFENLASKPALRVKLHPETLNEYCADEALECVSGNYTFSYEAEGKIQSFASRFTFVINATKDKPIIHHHSSRVPQPHLQ